jgi:rod shape determining protein RodA
MLLITRPLDLIEPRYRKNMDRTLLLCVGLLMAFSLTSIRFATISQASSLTTVIRQGIYFAVGLCLMMYVASRDYSNVRRFTAPLYWVNLFLLVVVLGVGHSAKGAARWIKIPGVPFQLQPSEFAKVIIILTLSVYVASLGPRIREFPQLLKTLGHVLVPMALIMKQPDLGTSLVFVAIWAGIVFLAGADWKHLFILAAVGVGLFGVAWYGHLLKPYQRARVTTFINPLSDPKGKGYHVLQSEIAIGGGQVTGQGIGAGIQTNLNWVPENHTDFIFTVVGEETGFVGACVLLSVYGVFLWRGIATIAECEDQLGRLIAGGVVTLFAFHLTVNIGMTCGMMPVVGVPLPLMSFGGSAAWANLTAIGLLLGIHMRRHKILF